MKLEQAAKYLRKEVMKMTKIKCLIAIAGCAMALLSGCESKDMIMDGDGMFQKFSYTNITQDEATEEAADKATEEAADKATEEITDKTAEETTDKTIEETTEKKSELISKEVTLRFDSFDGGGPEYNVIIKDESIVSYTAVREYAKADHDMMTGAGYDMVYTFTGLKPGKTDMLIEARSPIADNFDINYRITVSEDMSVKIEEVSATKA